MAAAVLPGRLVVAGISKRGSGLVWTVTPDKLFGASPSEAIVAEAIPESGVAEHNHGAAAYLGPPLAIGAVGNRLAVAAGASWGLLGLWDLTEGLIGKIEIGAEVTVVRFAAPSFCAIGTEHGLMVLQLHSCGALSD